MTTLKPVQNKERWGDSSQETNKDSVVSENNKKYGEWWCENLSKRASIVVYLLKFNTDINMGKKTWARNAVRVKVFNTLNSSMEEHSLYDIVKCVYEKNGSSFLPVTNENEKCQANIVGTYYISHVIYKFLNELWNNTNEKVDKESKD